MAIGQARAASAANPAAPKARAGRPPAQAKPAATPDAAAGVAFVSLNPDTFGVGGLIDDIDVEITDALAVLWDYNGQQAAGPALAVEYTDVNGAAHIQYYSCGKAEDWMPHDSGEGFVAVSGKTGFNNNTNIGMLFASLVTAGFPKEHMTGNVKVIVGLKCHVLQQVTERKGLIRTGKNADRPSSVLLVSKIHQLPAGMGGAGVGATATAAAPRQATTQATAAAAAAATHVNGAAAGAGGGGSDLDAELQGYLQTALLELPEGQSSIEKKDIVKIVFKKSNEAGKTAPERNKAVIRAGQQDFLTGLGAAGIAYSGTEISLAE
jgi:hypothetical protein